MHRLQWQVKLCKDFLHQLNFNNCDLKNRKGEIYFKNV
jgi:hypothetical protein